MRTVGTQKRSLPSWHKAVGWGCLLGMPISSEYGGAGRDYLTYAIVLEEIARTCAAICVDVSCHTGCALVINDFGNEEQKQKYTPLMANGKNIDAFCCTEPGAGTDMSSMTSTAVLNGDS